MSRHYLRRTLGGIPYTFRPVPGGYAVTCNSSPADHFHRCYTVRTGPDGRAISCTCPDAVYRKRVCKHMRTCEELANEKAPVPLPLG